MAEPVYKKITELDTLSASLDGNETLPIVKAGKTYRRTWANFFGSGWITSLLGAFTAFKAPDADHADDADTVGGETAAQLHAAASLTGNIHLDRIPAELTGKNAATATVSAACSGNAATAMKLQTARTIGGVSFDGSANINLPGVNTLGNQDTTGNAATSGRTTVLLLAATAGKTVLLGNSAGLLCNTSTGTVSFIYMAGNYTVPANCRLYYLDAN